MADTVVKETESKVLSTGLLVLILILITGGIVYAIDRGIKKKTGGAFGLLGALEIGAGGVVAYKLYKTFGSGGSTVIEADGTSVAASAATTDAAGIVDTTGAGAVDTAVSAATATGESATILEGLGGGALEEAPALLLAL